MTASDDATTTHDTTKSRLPKGSGTIYQTTLRGKPIWYASIELPVTDGKRKRITGTGTSQTQAIARRNDNYQKHLIGSYRKPYEKAAPTVEAYIKLYLELKKSSLKPESYRKVQRDLEIHILPKLGKMKLNELTEQQLNHHFYTSMKDAGNSAKKNAYKNFSAVLNHAVERSVIPKNELRLVTTPKAPSQVKQADEKFINPRVEYYKALVRKMDKEQNEYLPMFMFLTLGFRKAEMLGFTWNCVSNLHKVDKATITVMQQLKRYEVHEEKTGWYIAPYTKGRGEETKTRTVYLPETYRKMLVKLKREQDKQPKIGAWYEDLIFQYKGKHCNYNNLEHIWNSEWQKYLGNQYESKRFRIHYVRHIAASLMSAQGITIETIQDVLGHSDAAISLHYRKQMREQRQAATLTIDHSIR